MRGLVFFLNGENAVEEVGTRGREGGVDVVSVGVTTLAGRLNGVAVKRPFGGIGVGEKRSDFDADVKTGVLKYDFD
jgi:hypothetical protein